MSGDDRAYGFGPFRLVAATRSLFEGERLMDLPPRYFDLLLLLIDRRNSVVTKDDLYEQVWKDEIVTEGAIAQGVRFVRRVLGDDARKPRFIRTVTKYGYQWIGELTDGPGAATPDGRSEAIDSEPPKAGPASESSTASEVVTAFRIALGRYAFASLGSAISGAVAGALGGALLVASSPATNPIRVVVVLALLGVVVGGLGGLGVGFGLSFAESLVRRHRAAFLAVAGGISGSLLGGLAHLLFAETLTALFGRSPGAFGGAYEGAWIGTFTGFGYGLATRELALAAPRDRRRLRVVTISATAAAMGAALGSAFGASFSATSVDAIAALFRGSQLSLSSIGWWMGEPSFGRTSRIVLSAYEGLFFGAGLVYGLTRRPGS